MKFDIADSRIVYDPNSELALEFGNDAELTEENHKYLHEIGIETSSPEEAFILQRATRDCFRYNSNSASIVIHMGYNCNLDCSYCYQNLLPVKSHLKQPQLKSASDLIYQLSKSGTSNLDLCFIGGEPLLYTKSIEFILANLPANLSVHTQVVTNGTLLSNRLKKTILDSIDEWFVTIDGEKTDHDYHRKFKFNSEGSYDLILENLFTLPHNISQNIVINCNLTKRNQNSVNTFLKELRRKDFPGKVVFSEVFEPSGCHIDGILKKTDTLWSDCVLEAEKFGYVNPALVRSGRLSCPMFMPYYFIIGADGYLYSCLNGVGRSAFRLSKLEDYLFSDPVPHRVDAMLESKKLEKICEQCEFLTLCDGNCEFNKWLAGRFDCPRLSIRRNERRLVQRHIEKGVFPV